MGFGLGSTQAKQVAGESEDGGDAPLAPLVLHEEGLLQREGAQGQGKRQLSTRRQRRAENNSKSGRTLCHCQTDSGCVRVVTLSHCLPPRRHGKVGGRRSALSCSEMARRKETPLAERALIKSKSPPADSRVELLRRGGALPVHTN